MLLETPLLHRPGSAVRPRSAPTTESRSDTALSKLLSPLLRDQAPGCRPAADPGAQQEGVRPAPGLWRPRCQLTAHPPVLRVPFLSADVHPPPWVNWP